MAGVRPVAADEGELMSMSMDDVLKAERKAEREHVAGLLKLGVEWAESALDQQMADALHNALDVAEDNNGSDLSQELASLRRIASRERIETIKARLHTR